MADNEKYMFVKVTGEQLQQIFNKMQTDLSNDVASRFSEYLESDEFQQSIDKVLESSMSERVSEEVSAYFKTEDFRLIIEELFKANMETMIPDTVEKAVSDSLDSYLEETKTAIQQELTAAVNGVMSNIEDVVSKIVDEKMDDKIQEVASTDDVQSMLDSILNESGGTDIQEE